MQVYIGMVCFLYAALSDSSDDLMVQGMLGTIVVFPDGPNLLNE